MANRSAIPMTMTDATTHDDQDEEERDGPSLAFSPHYILRTAIRCPRCDEAMHVFTLGCAAYHDSQELRPVKQFHFFHRTESVPGEVLALLKAKCPSFYLDQQTESSRPYLMNHCRCGAQIDDDYVHGEVWAAFWPDRAEGFGEFKLFRLPIEGAIPIKSGYTVGGGDYLDYDHAED